MIELKFKIKEDQCMIRGKTKDDAAKMIKYVVEKRIKPTSFSRGKLLSNEQIFGCSLENNYRDN